MGVLIKSEIKMNRCTFETKYFDYQKNETTNFTCNEEPFKTDFCIFHDYNSKNNEEVISRLDKKIKNGLAKKQPILCIGYKIPKIKINESFSEAVYFNKTQIDEVDFSGSVFNQADFSGSTINTGNFSKTTFEELDFLGVECKKNTNFSKVVSKNKANFSESSFNSANFSESSLLKAHFLNTVFKTADFGLAKMENADFFGAKFEENVSFIGAEINMSKFEKTKFQKTANFIGTTLTKVNFPQCEFSGLDFSNAKLQVVSLRGTVYNQNANFSLSKFEKVDFFNARFKKDAIFSETNMNQVVFPNTLFSGSTKFVNSIFKDVQFNNSKFQEADFSNSKFEEKTSFNDVLFHDQSKVNFDVDNLSQVSFMNTDITNIRISDRVKWGGANGNIIIDEDLLKDSTSKTLLESIIAIYRNIRKNYERRYRYEEAKKFFSRELELRRKYQEGEPQSTISDIGILEKKVDELSKEFHELKNDLESLKSTNKNFDDSETK